MTDKLDQLMERASLALVKMDYLECEARCLEALALARQQGNWSYYARILLPLQEARRQRRMIAADGTVRLGSSRAREPTSWLRSLSAGCMVVTHPHKSADARQLDAAARSERRHVEVLYADNDVSADGWTVRSFNGPAVRCLVPAPPYAWRDLWLAPGERPTALGGAATPHTADAEPGDNAIETADTDNDNDNAEAETNDASDADSIAGPADWFLDAAEQLGDAALDQVQAPEGAIARVEQLEQMLLVVSDHEILHQRLGDAARAMR